MHKHILTLVFSFLLFTGAFAQKGGLVYYLKNNGKLVSTKDSADYSMVVLPPDTSADKSLFVVYEYDKNGKVRLVTSSKTNDINLLYQGRYIAYFPDGKKKTMGSFENGKPTGREIDFYPNGKLYVIKTYSLYGKVFFNECKDTIGNTLTENGKGKWIQYNDDFTEILTEGNIENGVKEGEWKGRVNKYEYFKSFYNGGELVKSDIYYKPDIDTTITKTFDIAPLFEGDFGRFLWKNMRYPAIARENGIKGKVIISMVVETDGTLTNVKLVKGIGGGCDEEAVRVIRLSPPWKPALANGKPVRVVYKVPIVYELSN